MERNKMNVEAAIGELLSADSSNEVKELFQSALARICVLAGWSVGHVYFSNPKSLGELVPSPIWHLENRDRFDMFRQVSMALRFSRGAGLPGRAFATARSVFIPDIEKSCPNFFARARLALDAGCRAAFAFPVVIQRRPSAALEFFAREAGEPSRSILDAVERRIREVGTAIEEKFHQTCLSSKGTPTDS